MHRVSLIVVTSPPLELAASHLIEEYFPEAILLSWSSECKASDKKLKSMLVENEFDACLSLYSDYIFKASEIAKFKCIVNVHPALPSLRGRGYDILPLVLEHKVHGATLHFISEEIDAGEIIDVISQPLPVDLSYEEIRGQNQKLSLMMAQSFLETCTHFCIDDLVVFLRKLASTSVYQWEGDCVTSLKLAHILRSIRKDVSHSKRMTRLLDVPYVHSLLSEYSEGL